MEFSTMLRRTVATVVVIALCTVAFATQRAELLKLSWGSTIPEPGDPLLVYVSGGEDERDQERFDTVVMANESLLLAAKFFTCVEVSADDAAKHPLFEDVKVKAPAMVAFDSTRERHSVAAGRASAMKVYGVLCKVGQLDYETNIASTVREARTLLGNFDRIDAAQDALGIKQSRLDEALADDDSAKIRKLTREIEKDQAAIDAAAEKAQAKWAETWKLVRKKRD